MTKSINKSKMLLASIFAALMVLTMFAATQTSSAYSWRNKASKSPSIAQIAVENGNFTTLVKALQCTGLDGVAASKYARLTVFAPTDAAFEKLSLNKDNVCSTFDKRTLRNILLYHITWGNRDSGQVLGSSSLRMLNWQKAPIVASVPSIGGAEINTSLIDIKASNGIVHVLNDVMLP